jgi:hypothetical protein
VDRERSSAPSTGGMAFAYTVNDAGTAEITKHGEPEGV